MSVENLGFKKLEAKVLAILEHHQNILNERDELQKELAILKEKMSEIRSQNIALIDQVNHLKMTNAMSGNQEHRKMMKLKMNKLIKEVDACIAQIKNKN
ncbi:hypothetical protein [Vaginella massiliensis]|uniref:hypothetical protein n=1 Tax=Vaginella massiliensis TaxID=1816680 RepID=UPI000838D4BB|nr:hypothetical protein [Vaginella massiliensis]